MDVVGKIYISPGLLDKMGLEPRSVIKIRVGVKTVYTKMVVRKGKLKSYMLSPELAKRLGLKRRKVMQICYDKSNDMLHVGPFIGILTNSLPNEEEYDSKSVQAELIFLSKIGKTLPAQIYLFTPYSINWANRTVRGYNYRKIGEDYGRWESSIYPLPDVVYDRISTRSGEARSRTSASKKKLKSMPYLKYFNPAFLNKWRVHQLLSRNPFLCGYLPETRQLNRSNLEEMLKRYKVLYLKPSNGSLGRGIIKVNCKEKGQLCFTIYRNGKNHGTAIKAEDLLKKTRSFRRGKSYIVQQGLNLARYHGRPFDLRIIFQKNRDGEWKIGKKFVRVAAPGSSVANLSRGGKAETSKKVLSVILDKDDAAIDRRNNEIKMLCAMIANTLEEQSGSTFGELGLDIGIDINGKPWLIEVNSKPRKTTDTDLSMAIVRATFRRPLEYAIHLAGFSSKK